MGRKSKKQLQKEKQYQAINSWNKKNTIKVSMRFSKEKESDIINRLDSVPSKKTYIVDLIRDDMKEGN